MKSRLARRVEKQSKKQLYLSIFGLVILLVIIVKLAPPAIGLLGRALDFINPKSQQSLNFSDSSIQPPVLDDLPAATPSSSIKITGRSYYQEGEVDLFVDGSLVDSVPIGDSQDFEFEDVSLSEGENKIKARQNKGDKKSEFTEEITVLYIKDEPKLEVSSPQDKASFQKADQEINVSGKTDPDNLVTINGFRAIVDSQGNFSYLLSLNEGENKIKIEATNSVDKKITKEITVSYSR